MQPRTHTTTASPSGLLTLLLLALLLVAPYGCGDDDRASSDVTDTSATDTTADTSATDTSTPDTSATDTSKTDTHTADTGPSKRDLLLAALRSDRDGALQTQSELDGWPPAVEGGWLVVSTDPALTLVAGDFDGWSGTAMTVEGDFAWTVIPATPGSGYKFTDLSTWSADPWARAYTYDGNGQLSLITPSAAHLERFFAVADANIGPRMVRVWVPAEPVTHLLYVHDGQNLFDPEAMWGGWHLQDAAQPGMMMVGIDNTGARMDEYTHVEDDIGSGLLGGLGDAYADYVQNTVRGLIRAHYGEPSKVGVMGSSLGGLIAFHIADRYPADYDYAASLSGTMGWGSIGLTNETMIERFAAAGHRTGLALYLDSGGNGTCFDADGDGIEDDDPDAADNYCENKQLERTLAGAGYTYDSDLWHWHEPDAPHNEAAWAARVFRPLEVFAGL